MSPMNEFDHLKIRLKDIKEATENFGIDRKIGGGGFGPVYKGKLTLSSGRRAVVAFKRLDPRFGQGNTEFWKEIMLLSDCKHENLISLLGFCIEGEERILVYEYLSRGSLDRYLSNPRMTWNQRLKICVGVARALTYLHDPRKTQRRVLHRDIKSANILLDAEWTPKVSDFGLSKLAPANQPRTYVISNGVGTPGYCDPVYIETGFLCKESDVYSFGVVLFEVMCGKLCCEYRNGQLINILVPRWKICCDKNKLDNIICPGLKEQINRDSLVTFSAIANRCLSRSFEVRPTMAEILKNLEVALEQQNFNPENSALVDISKLAIPRISYTSHQELHSRLSKGILIDGGQTWVSVNKNGRIREMISAVKCVSGGWFVSDTADDSRSFNSSEPTQQHTISSLNFPPLQTNRRVVGLVRQVEGPKKERIVKTLMSLKMEREEKLRRMRDRMVIGGTELKFLECGFRFRVMRYKYMWSINVLKYIKKYM
ncbi:probable serine/threonine-protein kinase PBL7 isoform X2 [Lactuca sativa]|uniref:probable serine/threonine-protein kinase PBL7 isoform X2 n=1 Tax=Lactuca sativa TaxID=4236 RepID=UPI000CD969A5|nr:probable serine/threonine-protein kinase PBL7 isoform X2 [Lactuca sativa]